MNTETTSPIQKKKGSLLKKIGIGIAIFFGFIILVGILSGPSSDTPQNTNTDQKQIATFDVPTLVGKNIPELVVALGTPDENTEPNALQLENGTKTWEKSWKKDNYFLMATYDVVTMEVVDLFVGADNDAGFESFKNTDNILKAGNLTINNATYSVEFVKARNADGYTGAIVKKK